MDRPSRDRAFDYLDPPEPFDLRDRHLKPLSAWGWYELLDWMTEGKEPPAHPFGREDILAELLRRERERCAVLLDELADGHERFGTSGMSKLHEMERAIALRDAAKRVRELG